MRWSIEKRTVSGVCFRIYALFPIKHYDEIIWFETVYIHIYNKCTWYGDIDIRMDIVSKEYYKRFKQHTTKVKRIKRIK
jgi:hypothetical protein